MVKNFTRFLLFALVLLATGASAQTQLNLLGKLSYGSSNSDIWGYADGNGKEYAIVGVYNGTSIVDVTDPTNPTQVAFISGPRSTWRDMKVWNGYAYVTHDTGPDAGVGLTIIDLSNLPSSAPYTTWVGGSLNLRTAHNIFIDEKGIAYIAGSNNGNGGVLFLDLNADPTNPTYLGRYNLRYVHDLFVRGDTMWTAEINNGIFSVVNVTNKAAPTVMATNSTPANFSHNLWLSDDGNTLLTTDEISNSVVASYDVSDLSNITYMDNYGAAPGTGVIPHNVFIMGDFAFIAYYTIGVKVLDMKYPNNLIEVGYYDTSPSYTGSGYNGCWGVYPYLPSGNILATDIQEGLIILGNNYDGACYLTGTVTDTFSSNPLNGVSIQIIGTSVSATTDLAGNYQTGIADSGTYTIQFSKSGYITKTVTVTLQNGVSTVLDVELVPAVNITLTGQVTDSATGQGINNAMVMLVNTNGSTYQATTNGTGNFSITPFETGNYTFYAGQWGYVTNGKSISLLGNGATANIALKKGYYDDFIFDFSWTVTNGAQTGNWVRGEPAGTNYNGQQCNPDLDVQNDYGDQCYITGNGGGQAADDDVDNGTTVLTSPVFDLSAYQKPKIAYYRWFYNGGGSGTPNDQLVIQLSNGISTVTLETLSYNTPNANSWRLNEVRVSDYITPTANMRLIFTTSDINTTGGHLVEGGVDKFYVSDTITTPAPVANFSATAAQGCAGLEVTFSDISTNNPTVWAWSFPGGTPSSSNQPNPTVSYNTPGTYDVTLVATNEGGSSSYVQSGFVTVNPSPDVSLAPSHVSCAGAADGSVATTVNNGLSPYTYQWSNGATGFTVSGLAAGTYMLTVVNNKGCNTQLSVTITEPAPIIISGSVANSLCGNADGGIQLAVSGGTPSYNYNWSTGATTSGLSNIGSGNYTVSVSDNNGCNATKGFTVNDSNAPVLSYNSSSVSCYGATDGSISLSFIGGQPPYSINWSNGSSAQNLFGLTAGQYDVTVTDANGCVTSDNIQLTEPAEINPGFSVQDASCGNADGQIALSVTGGSSPYAYQWSTGATTSGLSNLSAGNYDLTITDNKGCAYFGGVQVVNQNGPALNALVSDVSCNGASDGSINLNISSGTPPYYIDWSGSNIYPSMNDLDAGTYTVTVTDDNLCENIATYTIQEPAVLDATVNVSNSVNGGFDAEAVVSGGTAPYTYEWSNGANASSTHFSSGGTYQLTTTDANGCNKVSTFALTGIANTSSENEIKVWPNPFADNIYLNLPANAQLSIYNLLGQQLADFNNVSATTLMWGEQAQAGVYILRVTMGNAEVRTFKIVKQER